MVVPICSLMTTVATPGMLIGVFGAGFAAIGVPLIVRLAKVVPAAEFVAVRRFDALLATVWIAVAEMFRPGSPRTERPRARLSTRELLVADDWVGVEVFVDEFVTTPVVKRFASPVLRTVVVPGSVTNPTG